MDQTLLIPAPFFDPAALREQLTSLWKEHSSQDSAMRARALELLTEIMVQAREAA